MAIETQKLLTCAKDVSLQLLTAIQANEKANPLLKTNTQELGKIKLPFKASTPKPGK